MKKTMIGAEWKQIFSNRKLLVPMIAILFIPVLYAGMFLWAFWDPYAQMNELPVAVVNLDEGADVDGKQLTIGKEVVQKLVDNKDFDFQEVTKEEAEKGLANQEYYIAMEFPENFSEHATTLLDDNPEKLTIIYKPNEGFNFLSAQIGETAMDRIKAEVNEKVASTYAEQLFDSITELGDGFGEAADGAKALHDGTIDVTDGAEQLQGYLQTLAQSTVTLADGSSQLMEGAVKASKGASDLHSGMTQLQDGSKQLQQGANEAASGASSLQQGVSDYTNGVAQLADSYAKLQEKEQQLQGAMNELSGKTGALHSATEQLSGASQSIASSSAQLTKQLQPVLAALPKEQQEQLQASLQQLEQGSAKLSEGMQQLAGNTKALQAGAQSIADSSSQIVNAQSEANKGVQYVHSQSEALLGGAMKLEEGNKSLATHLQKLGSGIDEAENGANALATGLQQVTGGASSMKEGTGTLVEKSQQLAEGSTALVNGMEQLNEGTSTLQEKLAEASGKTQDVHPSQKTYEMTAAPVAVDQQSINEVPNYGTGFAPYFISLGLFVGALLVSIVFPLVQPAIHPTGAFRWFASKVSVLTVVGLLQAFIAILIVKYALGMEVQNFPLFIVTAVVTSFTFIALVQMLVSIFSDAGRFIAIIVLILQLTTSAGTFPLELIPKALQVFNAFLPMTYSVQAFKASISTGDIAHLWASNGILFAFLGSCLLITFGYFALIFTRRYSKELAEA